MSCVSSCAFVGKNVIRHKKESIHSLLDSSLWWSSPPLPLRCVHLKKETSVSCVHENNIFGKIAYTMTWPELCVPKLGNLTLSSLPPPPLSSSCLQPSAEALEIKVTNRPISISFYKVQRGGALQLHVSTGAPAPNLEISLINCALPWEWKSDKLSLLANDKPFSRWWKRLNCSNISKCQLYAGTANNTDLTMKNKWHAKFSQERRLETLELYYLSHFLTAGYLRDILMKIRSVTFCLPLLTGTQNSLGPLSGNYVIYKASRVL